MRVCVCVDIMLHDALGSKLQRGLRRLDPYLEDRWVPQTQDALVSQEAPWQVGAELARHSGQALARDLCARLLRALVQA